MDADKFIEQCFPNAMFEFNEFLARYKKVGKLGFDDWQIVSEVASAVRKMLEEGRQNNCQDLRNKIIEVVTKSLDSVGIDRYSITRAYKHGMTEEVRDIILEIFPNIEWIREPTPIQVIESSQPRQEEIVVKPSRTPSQYDLPPIEPSPQQPPQQPKPNPPSPPPQQQPQTPKEPQNYSVDHDYEHNIIIDALIGFIFYSLPIIAPAAYVYSRVYPIAVQESSAGLAIFMSLILIGAIILTNILVKEYTRWRYMRLGRFGYKIDAEAVHMAYLILDVIAIIAVLIVYADLLITVINMNQIGAFIAVIFLGLIIFGGYILAREYAKYRLVKLLGPPR
ncbi:hypothetical protein [Vulcanisaeta sp. JCM 14467]|uniref:hypothetical protein n=1 Tax=Vulcanisaeta sp. JCM 14467 TaxID=1295370 RepID=UPI0006D06E41|nr:hypothetical protein [Vulcanisaeta sp. JCM 14467]